MARLLCNLRAGVAMCCGMMCESVGDGDTSKAVAHGFMTAGQWTLAVAHRRHKDVGADRKEHEDQMSCGPPSRLDDLQNCAHEFVGRSIAEKINAHFRDKSCCHRAGQSIVSYEHARAAHTWENSMSHELRGQCRFGKGNVQDSSGV